MLAFGGLFKLYSDQLPPEQQQQVLIQAIPFIAIFVSIVLAFACLIVLVAIAFNGKVPQRTYRPVERIIIAGIFIGIVGLFQGWRLFPYEYGFLVLLVSVLLFMVWSHLTPMSLRQSKQILPLSQRAHRIGLAVGIAVWLALAAITSLAARPVEPYGNSKQIWELMMDEEARAQAAQDAETDYATGRAPYLIFISLLPGAIAYLVTRELVDTQSKSEAQVSFAPPVTGSSMPEAGQ
ncbi:MAG: hypothetical protein K8L99_33405, partial [Anaerolineae bacterium]|nr:hypothetical protein [Anaerolineae bacterium]